jgi:uncharacterized repeat protein (TIGR02543 family)
MIKKNTAIRLLGACALVAVAMIAVSACTLEPSIAELRNSLTYTVTFNKNNTDTGSTEANPRTNTVAMGTAVGTLPTVPTRTGWTFNSWNTSASGNGSVFDENTEVTGNITVYAQWEFDWSSFTPSTDAEVLAIIKDENIKYWVTDGQLAEPYAQDKVPSEARTHLYYVYTQTNGINLTFDMPVPKWDIDDPSVDGSTITEAMLTYTDGGGGFTQDYGLWLVPVAQFNVVFAPGASGTININDGTDNGTIASVNTSIIGMVDASIIGSGTPTITIVSGNIKIEVTDEGGDVTLNQVGSEYELPALTSQIYTVTVKPKP